MNKLNHKSLTELIIKAIINVHTALGPGFLETIYHNALVLELVQMNLKIEYEKEISVNYKGMNVGKHRIDILVEDEIIIELKAVEQLNKSHYAQLKSYLKAAGLNIGLLVNFAADKADYRRMEV